MKVMAAEKKTVRDAGRNGQQCFQGERHRPDLESEHLRGLENPPGEQGGGRDFLDSYRPKKVDALLARERRQEKG